MTEGRFWTIKEAEASVLYPLFGTFFLKYVFAPRPPHVIDL